MAEFSWRLFLDQFSRDLLANERIRATLPPDVVASEWLGFSPATDAEIAALEQRLNHRLPPSYRSFLEVTNGWRCTGPFIQKLWSAADVAWLSQRRQKDIIDPWLNESETYAISDQEYLVYGDAQDTVNLRPQYLPTALEISDYGDAAIYLLNPQILDADGEWEAWMLASWLPGAARYRSFRELLQAAHGDLASFLD
jgi:hypothetical protein